MYHDERTTMNRSTTAPRILILGANGRFGAAAAQAFAAAGWTVLAQARRAPAALPAGAQHLAIALADTAALTRAAAGARAVVYAVNPPYTAWHTDVLPLARMGMELASGLGARFMLPGNVYNFGEGMPARLTEDTPQRPTTVKGGIRCELEAELAARAAQGLGSVVIRAGDFFGGGTGSWLDLAILKSIAKGRLVYPGPLELPHAWAYLPDLARAFVARPHAHGHRTAECRGARGRRAGHRAAARLAPRRHALGPHAPWWPLPADVARDRRDGVPVAGAARAGRQRAGAHAGRAAGHRHRRGDAPHAAGPRLRPRHPMGARHGGLTAGAAPLRTADSPTGNLVMSMSTMPAPVSPAAAAARHPAATRRHPGRSPWLGTLLIADALLALAPVAILGAAIGWPASLGRPAAEQLAAIHAHAGAVSFGYAVYLLYSMLVAPVMIGLATRAFGGLLGPVAATVAAFGALSALARSIGILRWLTVMPALASAHAAADPAARAQIELVFGALTAYGGGVGEVLGVSLFMAAAVGVLSLGALHRATMPRGLAWLGVLTAALLGALALPVLGVDLEVPVALAVSVLSLWMLAAGIWCLRR
jgi:uncharacterized protein YbjT (DUF2867 family)